MKGCKIMKTETTTLSYKIKQDSKILSILKLLLIFTIKSFIATSIVFLFLSIFIFQQVTCMLIFQRIILLFVFLIKNNILKYVNKIYKPRFKFTETWYFIIIKYYHKELQSMNTINLKALVNLSTVLNMHVGILKDRLKDAGIKVQKSEPCKFHSGNHNCRRD